MWARVMGPGTTGPFGGDHFVIDSADNVVIEENGTLRVEWTSKEGHPRITTYAQGRWNKFTTGTNKEDDHA